MGARDTVEAMFHLRITEPQDGDLPALCDDVVCRFGDEIKALLVHQPRDDAEQRPVRGAQAEAGAQLAGVGVLAGQVTRMEMVRQMRITGGVPGLVDSVNDP